MSSGGTMVWIADWARFGPASCKFRHSWMTDSCCPVAKWQKWGVVMNLSMRVILFLAAIFMVLGTEVLLTGRASRAADDCITKPNAAPPQGSHWYYRTDRTTQRQCWYLKPEGEKVRATVDQPTAAAQPPSAPKTKPVSTNVRSCSR